MADYDYRNAQGWKYLLLPIEQVKIEAGSNSLEWDMIDKVSIYDLEPITRGRGEFAKTKRTVAWRIAVEIGVLFDDLGTYIPTLNLFVNEVVNLSLFLSSTNISGQDEWRKLKIDEMNFTYAVKKQDNKPVLLMRMATVVTKTELAEIFTNWVSSEPA